MPAITKMDTSTAFETKLDKLNADLNIKNKAKSGAKESYAMWMNYDCETQKKSSRIVRFIKSVLSYILPISLFEPIKASKVALRYLQLVEKNQEYLQSPEIVEKAKNVLKTLNIRTGGKYSLKIEVCIQAINALAPKAPAAPINEQAVVDFLKTMDTQARINLLNTNGFTAPNRAPPAIPANEPIPVGPTNEPAPQPASPKTPSRPIPQPPKLPVTPAVKQASTPPKTPTAMPKMPPAPAKAPAKAPDTAPSNAPASPITANDLQAEIAKREKKTAPAPAKTPTAGPNKIPASIQKGMAKGEFLASGPWDEGK